MEELYAVPPVHQEPDPAHELPVDLHLAIEHLRSGLPRHLRQHLVQDLWGRAVP